MILGVWQVIVRDSGEWKRASDAYGILYLACFRWHLDFLT